MLGRYCINCVSLPLATEGKWFWYDVRGQETLKDGTEPMSDAEARWLPGQPNNSGNEDCIRTGMRDGKAGTIDSPCSQLRGFLCQLPLKGF